MATKKHSSRTTKAGARDSLRPTDCVVSRDDYNTITCDLEMVRDLVEVMNEDLADDSRSKTIAVLALERIKKMDDLMSVAWEKTKQMRKEVSHG